MIELSVSIGADVVKYGKWERVLDAMLLSRLRLRRIRHDKLCHMTKQALSTPFIPEGLSPVDFIPQEGLGYDGSDPVCLLLESTKPFGESLVSFKLLNESKSPRSVRYTCGADHIVRDCLFLFLPVSEKHAALMRSSLF